MRLAVEPEHVIDRIARETGRDRDLVRSVVTDAHHVVDRTVTDDVTVVLPPLAFGRKGDPVLRAVERRFTSADWREPWGLKALPRDQLAREIGLGSDVVDAYPIAFGIHIMLELLEWRGVQFEDLHAADPIIEILHAWRDTLAHPDGSLRRYHASHVGKESDFELWLVDHLDTLEPFGYPVELVKRQHGVPHGRIDMLCRVTRDEDPLREGDYLVIENKATRVDLPAHGQLTGYVGAVRRQVDGGVKVFGLLISDGTTVRLQEALIASGFGQLSLSVLGYRDHLYRQHQLTIDLDPALGTVEPVEPEKLLAGLDEGRTRSRHGS